MSDLRLPQSSADWIAHFQANAGSLLAIPWDQGAGITAAERDAIAASVQAFQLGESGEGKHLFRVADVYAAESGDREYATALRLFIGEEHRHSRDLARFLGLAGLPLIQHVWSDGMFRWVRHLAGLELSVAVLVAAEVIALVYYRALQQATGSPVLHALCEQVLSDEVAHVQFQCERLAIIRQRRSGWLMLLTNGAYRFLFTGMLFVLWWTHAPVYRAGGYGFRRFWRASWRAMERALRIMDPRSYLFEGAAQAEPARA